MTTSRDVLQSVADAHILVVDDNVANTQLVARILERAGVLEVTQVNDPREVAALLDPLNPDLVLLDLRMPYLDGFQVLDIVQRYAAGTYLPVVVVTADDTPESVQRALAMGAHDFVPKPINAAELVLRVRNLLLTRQAYRELRRHRAWLRSRLDLFEPELSLRIEDPAAMRAMIEHTIATNDFAIAIQPVVDMRDGSVVGGEALSRFPNDVLPHAGAWFTAAMELGVVEELEVAAFRRALSLLGTGQAPPSLSINLSPGTIMNRLSDLMAGDGEVPWTRVVLELTEHVPVEDYPALAKQIAPLRAAGARLAVDDAGAGFASLRHILSLHPDVVKIDRSIVSGVDRDPSQAAVAKMLAQFAAEAGMSLIAEGVETEGERAALLALGAHLGQGYLLGRPQIVS